MSSHSNKEVQSFPYHWNYKISDLKQVCHTAIVFYSQSTDRENLMKLLIDNFLPFELSEWISFPYQKPQQPWGGPFFTLTVRVPIFRS